MLRCARVAVFQSHQLTDWRKTKQCLFETTSPFHRNRWLDNSHCSVSIKHMMVWLNDSFNHINQWHSHISSWPHCNCTNQFSLHSPFFLIEYLFSCVFTCNESHLKSQMKTVWLHEATFENCLHVWFIYGPRFSCRPLFDKSNPQRKHLLLCTGSKHFFFFPAAAAYVEVLLNDWSSLPVYLAAHLLVQLLGWVG